MVIDKACVEGAVLIHRPDFLTRDTFMHSRIALDSQSMRLWLIFL